MSSNQKFRELIESVVSCLKKSKSEHAELISILSSVSIQVRCLKRPKKDFKIQIFL